MDSVPQVFRDPETTALREDSLELVARGESSEQEFFVCRRNSSGSGAGGSESKPAKCPEYVDNSLFRRKSKKGTWCLSATRAVARPGRR